MPGHLIDADCPCGFARSLLPGHDMTMAYTEREDDIETFAGEEIGDRKLKQIPDPFLSDPQTLEETEAHLTAKTIPQGPYVCPKCRRATLHLHFNGHWD